VTSVDKEIQTVEINKSAQVNEEVRGLTYLQKRY